VDAVSAVQELRTLVATYLEGSDDAPRATALLDAIDAAPPVARSSERHNSGEFYEQQNDTARLMKLRAKEAAHDAYLAANRALAVLDETADAAWVAHAEASRESAWKLYTALVLETEW
jgi:hypothetical protein